MLFQERHTQEVYEYRVEDVFGVVTLTSPQKLDGETLDALVVHVIGVGGSSGVVNEVIRFTFAKADLWLEEEEEEVIH